MYINQCTVTDIFSRSTFDNLNYNWYSGYSAQGDGLTWANHVLSGYGNSNISAMGYWWGAANNTGMYLHHWCIKSSCLS